MPSATAVAQVAKAAAHPMNAGLEAELANVAFRFTDRQTFQKSRITLADVLAVEGALASLITTNAHSYGAGWIDARPIIDADASHGRGAIGGMLPMQDCTTLTVGREFIASIPGHLADGEVWFSESDAVAYRVRVVAARTERAA